MPRPNSAFDKAPTDNGGSQAPPPPRPPPVDTDAAVAEAALRRASQTFAHPPHHLHSHQHHNGGGGGEAGAAAGAAASSEDGSDSPSSPLSARAASLRDCFECGVPSKLALSIVVLGASGDLARKKTYPALFALYAKGFAPQHVQVVGYARSPLTDEALREQIRPHLKGAPAAKVEAFLKLCTYVHGDVREPFLLFVMTSREMCAVKPPHLDCWR